MDAEARAGVFEESNHCFACADLPAKALRSLLNTLPGIDTLEYRLHNANPPELHPGAEVYFYTPSTE